MITRAAVPPPLPRVALQLEEDPARRRPESSLDAPASSRAASYPVVTTCRRISEPAPAPQEPKPATTRPILPSEITIAAGVPLPLSAGPLFKKIAAVSAMAALVGILVVAFTRQPKGVDGGPFSSNVSSVAKTLVIEPSSNLPRAVRGKVGAPSRAHASSEEIGAEADDATNAGDTTALAAYDATTSESYGSSGSPMRTALVSTSKGKLGSSPPMKQAKYVQPAHNAKPKKAAVAVKHTTAKAAPWHAAKARPAATKKGH